MMNSKSTTFLIIILFVFAIETATCFNVTKMLEQYSDFSAFNEQLTQTQIASQINSRQTITVLAVDNAAMSAISGTPADQVKKILSLHVILDYYDVQKLQKLDNNTAILTTLFQSSGLATGQQGFLNVTDTSSGSVAFRSAVPGSSQIASLMKSVVSQPYNISVLQISTIVIPAGLGSGVSTNSSSQTPPASSPTTAPGKTPGASPAKSPSSSSAPAPKSGKAPTPSTKSPSPKSSKAPSPSKSDAPSSDADAPSSNSPAGSPVADSPDVEGPVADSPDVEGPVADSPAGTADAPAEADAKSSDVGGGAGVHGLALLVMVLCSVWSLSLMV